jgi:hypothetical protein
MLYGAIYRKEPYHFKDIVFQFNVATIVCNVKIKKYNQSISIIHGTDTSRHEHQIYAKHSSF